MSKKAIPVRTLAPKIGDTIRYFGDVVGIVTAVEGNLCWRTYPDGERLPFIWRFHDIGLNPVHDWPGKPKIAERKA
jgi:hypothetical protein